MAGQAYKEYPAIKGLSWYRDQYFSFFVPMDWYKLDWSDERNGVLYTPDLDEPQTVFAVYIRYFDTTFMPEDLDPLADGFLESIHSLPEAVIESLEQRMTGDQLEVEAQYTFCDGVTRRRWVRMFYHHNRQIVMTAQGATLEKYDYWLPVFFEAMMTARIHNQTPALATLA